MPVPEFPLELIQKVRCQRDAGRLEVETTRVAGVGGGLLNGTLHCATCGTKYEVADGILILIGAQPTMHEASARELVARDTSAVVYDQRLEAMRTREFKEERPTLSEVGDVSGQDVIEYGCGTGRYTTHMARTCRSVLAIDFSLESLRILRSKLQTANVGLVQADCSSLQTAPGAFHLAFSAQLLEHIPSASARHQLLSHARETLVDNGRFVCTVYHHDFRRRMRRKPVEGVHRKGAFFHYFSVREIKTDTARHFRIERVYTLDVWVPFERRLGLTAEMAGRVSVFCQSVFPLNRFARLVLVAGRKR